MATCCSSSRRLQIITSHLAPAGSLHGLIFAQPTSEVLRELLVHAKKVKGTSPAPINGIAGLKALVGKELGVTEYVRISQERINAFADATGDHQWIHVDVERANKESPFGGPIAHGLLTLSLAPWFVEQVMPRVGGVKYGVNYGFNKIRFVSPVAANSNLRARINVHEVTDVKGGVQVVLKLNFELEGSDKPAATVEWIVRHYV